MSDGKAPILLNNLDSWLISYILYTLSVMLVYKERPATYSFVNWAYLVFSGFAFVKWSYFREERIHLYYIWLSDNKKLDCSKIQLYSIFHSFTSIHPFFKTSSHSLTMFWGSGPKARATHLETSLRNKSERQEVKATVESQGLNAWKDLKWEAASWVGLSEAIVR